MSSESELPDMAGGALSSLEEVVNFEPTIAIFAPPANEHVEELRMLPPFGAHGPIQKPLAMNANPVFDLLQIAEGGTQTTLVGYN